MRTRYRLAKLQSGMGIPLPAATQWKLAIETAGILEPAFQELIIWAAQGDVIYQDDTTMKVLSRRDLALRGTKQRKGVYTSGIISKAGEHWVALFLTGLNHAGENLAEVLRRRRAELGKPIQMCDAASAMQLGSHGVKTDSQFFTPERAGARICFQAPPGWLRPHLVQNSVRQTVGDQDVGIEGDERAGQAQC